MIAWSLLMATSQALAQDAMTIDFSFRESRGCVTLFPNPEIKFQNIPVGAKSVLLRLRQGARELGGQEVLMPASGILPANTVRTFAPCNPGTYAYEAIVKSTTGQVLAKTEQLHFFPND